ncbi:MAG: hypothetical protein ACYDAG_10255, partial [Chloroflexota bacterium]
FAQDEMARFGVHLSPLQFGLGVAILVALQAAAIARSATGRRGGYLLAAFWLVGAGVLHLPDVLAGLFRAGPPSITLVAGIMVLNLAILVAAGAALGGARRASQATAGIQADESRGLRGRQTEAFGPATTRSGVQPEMEGQTWP